MKKELLQKKLEFFKIFETENISNTFLHLPSGDAFSSETFKTYKSFFYDVITPKSIYWIEYYSVVLKELTFENIEDDFFERFMGKDYAFLDNDKPIGESFFKNRISPYLNEDPILQEKFM